MKPLQISRIMTTALALLTVITVSSCGGKQENASDTSTTTTTTTTATAPTPVPTAQATQAAATTPQGTTCPSGSPIKGITSKRLGKIALTTKSPEYKTAKAEKCFPTTAAAQQAGYKVPK